MRGWPFASVGRLPFGRLYSLTRRHLHTSVQASPSEPAASREESDSSDSADGDPSNGPGTKDELFCLWIAKYASKFSVCPAFCGPDKSDRPVRAAYPVSMKVLTPPNEPECSLNYLL